MFRKSLLFCGLIAILCLSGCSNANELPGYNAKSKHSSADFYKNDLMDSILSEKIYNATSAADISDATRLLYRVDEMNAEQRRDLNYSMWRAQYNAVTEVHMHTDKGGLSYTLPFPAFKGGTQSAPIPDVKDTNALVYTFNHPFIYTSLVVDNHPYEQSTQYLGKPYNELKQGLCAFCIAGKMVTYESRSV